MFHTSRFATLSCLVFALFLQSFSAFGDKPKLKSKPLVDLEDFAQNLGQPPGSFHPSKMDVGPDGKIYFNNAIQNTTYRVDDKGNLERVATYGGHPVFGPGFLLGLQFDAEGNLYVVNLGGLWKVDAGDIPPGPNNTVPFDASGAGPLFAVPAPVLPMSVGTDNQGHAYVSDMVGGRIFKVKRSDDPAGNVAGDPGDGADPTGLWADNDEYPLLGIPDSNNFLKGFPLCGDNCGFGVVEVMPGPNGQWLYYTNHEGNAIRRIEIRAVDGSAGQGEDLGEVPPSALNGAYLDPVENRIIAGSPFTNFEFGFSGAVAAGTLFVLDLNDLDSEIQPLVEMQLKDGKGAVAVDAVSGRDVGSGHPKLLYVLDGSFDTLLWPGDPSAVPDPFRAPHAAIRVIKE